jgi:hypothetical protein
LRENCEVISPEQLSREISETHENRSKRENRRIALPGTENRGTSQDLISAINFLTWETIKYLHQKTATV